MGLIMLFNAEGSAIMLLSLVAALGLTWWECREHEYGLRLTLWWMSLVLLVHVPGYLALRLWTAAGYRSATR